MLKDCIEVYDDVFTPEECKNFMYNIDEMTEKSIMVNETKIFEDRRTIDADHITTNIAVDYNLKAWSSIGMDFLDKIKKPIEHYFNEYSVLLQERYLFYDIKVKKIPKGGGFHRWHHENGSVISCTRSIVVQLYLNDDFEGGETEFLYVSKRINAKAGRLVIFPAGYTHTHRGNPPMGNSKYIITTWGIQQNEE